MLNKDLNICIFNEKKINKLIITKINIIINNCEIFYGKL